MTWKRRLTRRVLDRIMPALMHRWGLAWGWQNAAALGGQEMRGLVTWAGYLRVNYGLSPSRMHEALWLAARHTRQGTWERHQEIAAMLLEHREAEDAAAPDPLELARYRIKRRIA